MRNGVYDAMNLSHITRNKMLAIVIFTAVLQIALLICSFCFFKKGFAGDEIYSYATANSSETMSPIIDFDGTLHLNEWIPSESLMNAVIVEKDEIFNYGHINDILRDDAHPPLYFYLLHFFSSFFQGSFSWVPSIVINSLSIFVMLIFFYRLFLLFCDDRYISLLAMIFFGLTSAAVNMMTFSRNYTLMTAFMVIFIFYLFKAMQQHELKKKSAACIILASISLYLAAMSQYLSIAFGFLMTFFICIYYLLKKDLKFMFAIGLSMSLSILLMIASFHHVIYQLANDQTSMEMSESYPFLLELRITIRIIFHELFGIKTPVQATMISFWLFWGCIMIVGIYLILRFLFRADQWFIELRKKTLYFITSYLPKKESLRLFQYFSLLSAVLILILIIAYKFKMYFFYPNSNRYLFITFPFAAFLILMPVLKVLKNKLVVTVLVTILSASSLFLGPKPYLGNSNISVSDVNNIINGSDIIVFSQNYYAGVNLGLLYLENSDRVFFTTDYTYNKNMNKIISGLSEEKTLYMLYLWPAYTANDTKQQLLNILKNFEDYGITTINDTPKNYGAKLIEGFGGFVLIQLR